VQTPAPLTVIQLVMPSPDDLRRQEALGRLDEQATALEARSRHAETTQHYAHQTAAQGYRLMAVLIGGVLVGLALGLAIDGLAHTAPFGIIAGVLIGFAVSVFTAVRTAQAMSAKSAAAFGPAKDLPDAPDDEDEV
jgi:ATP synthase protein I